MKKAELNYWVDLATGVAFLLVATTGVVRLFPAAAGLSADGTPVILGVSTTLWTVVHDWGGVVMTAGAGLHTVLHLRWLVNMTRKLAGGRRVTTARGGGGATVAARAGASLAAAPARPSAAPAPATPETSLQRLRSLGSYEGLSSRQGRRYDRKAFLAGAATLGGGVLLAGLGIAAGGGSSTSSTASATTPTSEYDNGSSDSNGWQGGRSQNSSTTTQGSGTTGATARVVVDSSCVGCGACLHACPHGVFTWDGSVAVARDPGACSLCGRCLGVCRPNAITLNA